MACVFETFRKESINSFELDPTHFVSTPDHSWDAKLRFIDIDLKLISDVKKYQFLESTIRGGISMICKSYAETNDKFFKSYDTNKPTSYKLYNLYEHSMMQLLPTEILDYVNPKDFNSHFYSTNSPIDYFLKVNFDYPDELPDLHNSYYCMICKRNIVKSQKIIILLLVKTKNLFLIYVIKYIYIYDTIKTLFKFRITIKKKFIEY